MSAKKIYDIIGEIDNDILLDTEQFIRRQKNSERGTNGNSSGVGRNRGHRLSRAATAVLAASLAIVIAFGGMITAQAAGADVFGAIAQWTEKVFRPGDLPFIDAFPEDGVIKFTKKKASCIPDTLLSMDEDTQVDYVITVNSLEGGGTVYFSVYIDGQWNQEQGKLRSAGEVVLHGAPGRSILMISASRDITADLTVTRVPRETTE